MTTPWTPTGDKWPQMAMVMIKPDEDHAFMRVIGSDGDCDLLNVWFLRPMPPAITPEQQAVLGAAERQEKAWHTRRSVASFEYDGATHDTNEAVRDMRAAQQPHDPVKELREAWHNARPHCAVGVARMEAAIAALEAKS